MSKRELEDKTLIENMKRPLRTEKELWDWFRYMRNFDLTRIEERRQPTDVFVNTVFLYSDRFLLTLNFGYSSKTVLFTDILCLDKNCMWAPQKQPKMSFFPTFGCFFCLQFAFPHHIGKFSVFKSTNFVATFATHKRKYVFQSTNGFKPAVLRC